MLRLPKRAVEAVGLAGISLLLLIMLHAAMPGVSKTLHPSPHLDSAPHARRFIVIGDFGSGQLPGESLHSLHNVLRATRERFCLGDCTRRNV